MGSWYAFLSAFPSLRVCVDISHCASGESVVRLDVRRTVSPTLQKLAKSPL